MRLTAGSARKIQAQDAEANVHGQAVATRGEERGKVRIEGERMGSRREE